MVSGVAFLFPSEVYSREDHGDLDNNAGEGGLSWVTHENGHLFITMAHRIIIIFPSLLEFLLSNKRTGKRPESVSKACPLSLDVLKRWPPGGGARGGIFGKMRKMIKS